MATKGWVGIGLSPDGKMINSDLIMCYINNQGNANCSDRFANGNSAPVSDESLGGKNDI